MADAARRLRTRQLLMRLEHHVHEDLLQHRGEYSGGLRPVNVPSVSLGVSGRQLHHIATTHEIRESLVSLLLRSHSGSLALPQLHSRCVNQETRAHRVHWPLSETLLTKR